MKELHRVVLSVSETSPGRVVYRGVYATVKSSPQVLPFQAILRLHLRMTIGVICHRERSVAIPKIGVCSTLQAAPPSIAGIATVALLLRNDSAFLFFLRVRTRVKAGYYEKRTERF